MIRALICLACWSAAFRLLPSLSPTSSGGVKLLFGLLMVTAVMCLVSLIFQRLDEERT